MLPIRMSAFAIRWEEYSWESEAAGAAYPRKKPGLYTGSALVEPKRDRVGGDFDFGVAEPSSSHRSGRSDARLLPECRLSDQ